MNYTLPWPCRSSMALAQKGGTCTGKCHIDFYWAKYQDKMETNTRAISPDGSHVEKEECTIWSIRDIVQCDSFGDRQPSREGLTEVRFVPSKQERTISSHKTG